MSRLEKFKPISCTNSNRRRHRMSDFTEERNKAFVDVVMRDDTTALKAYCKKYGVPTPKDKKIMLAGVYKAVQECTNISQEVKDKAMIKCLELGFIPFIGSGGAE